MAGGTGEGDASEWEDKRSYVEVAKGSLVYLQRRTPHDFKLEFSLEQTAIHPHYHADGADAEVLFTKASDLALGVIKIADPRYSNLSAKDYARSIRYSFKIPTPGPFDVDPVENYTEDHTFIVAGFPREVINPDRTRSMTSENYLWSSSGPIQEIREPEDGHGRLLLYPQTAIVTSQGQSGAPL